MVAGADSPKGKTRLKLSAGQITLIYIIIGIAWIISSDSLVGFFISNKILIAQISVVKGCGFVLITALVLYNLLQAYRNQIIENYRHRQKVEMKYKLLFESNPIPMWVYSLNDFKFLYVNSAAINKYGYSEDEFYKMTLHDIRPKEEHERLNNNLAQEANLSYAFSGVWRHRKKNGELIYVEIDSHPIEFESQQAKLVLATDVTLLIETQAESKAVAAELNNFVYRASHDLRGPLARIIGLTHLLIIDRDDANLDIYLRMLNKTAILMDKMLGRLLSINTLRHHKVSQHRIDLQKLLDEIIEQLKESNEVDIDITHNVPAGFNILADREVISLALENIIDNAIKYRAPGKTPFVHINVWQQDQQLHIRVIDNGIGIPSHARSRIFDIFFRGTTHSHGSGLGLYIAQEALKRQHGTVELKTDKKEETVFEIMLPQGVIL